MLVRDAELALEAALRYFAATELDHCEEHKAGRHASVQYRAWQDLPDAIFPQGRSLAAGERAQFILCRAHTENVALGLGHS